MVCSHCGETGDVEHIVCTVKAPAQVQREPLQGYKPLKPCCVGQGHRAGMPVSQGELCKAGQHVQRAASVCGVQLTTRAQCQAL